jgi:hypothetical protein
VLLVFLAENFKKDKILVLPKIQYYFLRDEDKILKKDKIPKFSKKDKIVKKAFATVNIWFCKKLRFYYLHRFPLTLLPPPAPNRPTNPPPNQTIARLATCGDTMPSAVNSSQQAIAMSVKMLLKRIAEAFR